MKKFLLSLVLCCVTGFAHAGDNTSNARKQVVIEDGTVTFNTKFSAVVCDYTRELDIGVKYIPDIENWKFEKIIFIDRAIIVASPFGEKGSGNLVPNVSFLDNGCFIHTKMQAKENN